MELPVWAGGLILTFVGLFIYWLGNTFDENGGLGFLGMLGGAVMMVIGVVVLIVGVAMGVTWV